MTRFAEEAQAAYSRWRQLNPDGPLPIVGMRLRSGERWYFNGLAIAPAGVSTHAVTISSVGLNSHTLVIHDDDIDLFEIEPVEAVKTG